MLSPRLTNCPECADIPSLLKKIDCKLAELGNNLYNNISYMLNKPIPAGDILQLIGYRRILTYKYCNPNYVHKYSVQMIASRVIRLTVGCVSRCNEPERCLEDPCDITIVANPTTTSTSTIAPSTTTTSTSSSSTTTTSTTVQPTTTTTTTQEPTTTTTSSSSTSTTTSTSSSTTTSTSSTSTSTTTSTSSSTTTTTTTIEPTTTTTTTIAGCTLYDFFSVVGDTHSIEYIPCGLTSPTTLNIEPGGGGVNACIASIISDNYPDATNNVGPCSEPTTTTTTTIAPSTTTTTTVDPCLDCVAHDLTIGTQTWTGCNLDVTTFRNGDPIPEVTDPSAWIGLTTPAWCYYDNTSVNGPTYGKLYNWYAVNDPRGLAPVGYHIPSDTEWTTLTTFLGGSTVAGGALKQQGFCHWLTQNTATNSSGFSGLPGGYRSTGGSFFTSVGTYGNFWSTSQYDSTASYFLSLYVADNTATIQVANNIDGQSVRLIKD